MESEKNKPRLLLTGATGFIGTHFYARAATSGFSVRRILRRSIGHQESDDVVVAEMGADTFWGDAVKDIDMVVHLAARVHVMRETSADALQEFRRVNVDGTINLARQAAQAHVRKFLFLSSIKVNGEETAIDHPFTEEDDPAPEDPYGISKYEAEIGLQRLARETEMEVVIIRPPLVYGPGVKGNFRKLLQWVKAGVPLPLGSINNKRSLVAIDNLIDLMITCVDHPAAGNQIFLVSDGDDLSTTTLLNKVAVSLGKPARLFPVPVSLLQGGARLLGQQAAVQRLCGSLQVDISKAKQLLGWTPPITVDEGLRRAVSTELF